MNCDTNFRLRAPGRPYIAFDPGMTRDALAYHGCAELFQVFASNPEGKSHYRSLFWPLNLCLCVGALVKDVHTELIQHKRYWMIKRKIVKGKLSVDSMELQLNGSCPLMPEEVRNYLELCISILSWQMVVKPRLSELQWLQRTFQIVRCCFYCFFGDSELSFELLI